MRYESLGQFFTSDNVADYMVSLFSLNTYCKILDREIREVDRIWAEEMFGVDCEDIIEDGRRLLGYFATRRNT